MSQLAILISLLTQSAVALLLALSLTAFYRHYRRDYVCWWSAAWWAGTVHFAGSAAAFHFAAMSTAPTPASPVRQLASAVATATGLLFGFWLVLGGLRLAGKRVLRRRHRAVAAAMLIFTAGAVLSWILGYGPPEARVLGRLAFPTGVQAVGFALMAVTVARAGRPVGLGRRLVIMGAGGAALAQAFAVVLYLSDIVLTWTRYLGYLDMTLALTLGMGLVIWFLEAEQDRVAEVAEALRLSESKFSTAFMATPDAITITELATGRYLLVNDSFCRVSGWTREDVVGRTAGDIGIWADGGERDRVVEELRRDGSVQNRECRFRLRNGEVRVSLFSARLIELEGVPCLLSITRDVTELRAAQRTRERLARVLESVPDVVAVADPAGRLQFLNAAGRRVMGLDPGHPLGDRRIDELYPPELLPRVWGEALPAAVRDGSWIGEIRLRTADGNTVDVEQLVVANTLPDGTLDYFSVLARDVARQKALEAQLRHAQKMEAVGQLAGGVAHDFNNLLTVIGGYAELLASDPSGLAGEAAGEIRNARDRGVALTRQLLTFARKQGSRTSAVDAAEVVRGFEPFLRRLIGAHYALGLSVPSQTMGVRIEAGEIEQILMNLVVNARDAMPDGGRIEIALHPEAVTRPRPVRTGLLEAGRWVVLDVEDDGAGIAAEHVDRIFDPFFTTKAEGEGTGLGLSTVFGIVEKAGGYMDVESEPRAGTRMRVYLPRAVVGAAAASRSGEPPTGGSERVLVVDDDPGVRLFVSRCLRRHGYEVLEAEDGEEALERLEREDGDVALVLTDIVMPRLHGAALAGRVGARFPDVSILLMSGYPDRRGRLDQPVDDADLLVKPFSVAELLRRVRRVLDRRAEPIGTDGVD